MTTLSLKIPDTLARRLARKAKLIAECRSPEYRHYLDSVLAAGLPPRS